MKEITKYLGLVAILPLIAVALSSTYIGEADATEIKLKQMYLEDGGTSYVVVFTIWADDKPADAEYQRNSIALEAGKLLVTSDKASQVLPFMSVRAGSHTSVHTRIAADDPGSITASFFDEPLRISR